MARDDILQVVQRLRRVYIAAKCAASMASTGKQTTRTIPPLPAQSFRLNLISERCFQEN